MKKAIKAKIQEIIEWKKIVELKAIDNYRGDQHQTTNYRHRHPVNWGKMRPRPYARRCWPLWSRK